jgi:hypothetical protein
LFWYLLPLVSLRILNICVLLHLTQAKNPASNLPFALAAGLAIIAAINANVFDLSAIHLLSVTVFLWPAGIIILEIFYNREKPFEHIGLNILGLLLPSHWHLDFLYFMPSILEVQ